MKKRITCLLLVLAMVLGLATAAAAAEPAQDTKAVPDAISTSTVWSYLDDNTDPAGDPASAGYNRTSWTAIDFNDSAWKTAAGAFGAKNGEMHRSANLLAGCTGTDNYTTYYFRTRVNVSDASAVTKITGSVAYDDAVIVYINGVKVAAFNEDGITGNSSYCSAKADTTGSFEITDPAVLACLVDGVNVVSLELHNESAGSSDIYVNMSNMTFSTEALPVETALLDETASWTYSDDGTDPAGDSASAGYERTSWTAERYAASGWKSAVGPFGSKKGKAELGNGFTANTVLNGCNGSSDTPAYFFRTTFQVSSLEDVTKLVGSIQYDDGAIVYLNGQRVAAFDDSACDSTGTSLNKGFDENLQYGGSNSSDPQTGTFEVLDLSMLHVGENTIAVELHNGRATSSDVWFQMTNLAFSNEKVAWQSNISLSMGADESQMNFTWYSLVESGAKIMIADNAAMNGAESLSVTMETANDGQYSCKAVATGLLAGTTYYYQLENAGHKSEIYSFTTASEGTFSFVYAGDPQIGASGSTESDTLGWENTLNLVDTNAVFSDVSFLLSVGDQVNKDSSESQYDGYLDHDALTSLPTATAIGNHDMGSNAYAQHFNIANASDEYGITAAGGDNYFVYNHVLFMVLNSNNKSAAEHKAFMEEAIAATENDGIQWKIVVYHHSIYTVASHSSDSYITDPTGFKNTMAPILKELDIDVVLQGHDHVYCRTYMMDGLTPITESDRYEYANGTDQAPTAVNDPDGILYVTANSASGSKTYNIVTDVEFPFSAVQNQEHIANISKITVSERQFTITTYRTTDMTVVDEFAIKRDGGDAAAEHTVTFEADENASVDLYYSRDYTTVSETDVTSAVSRNGETGALDVTGSGEVNFKVNVAEGYEIASITADANASALVGTAVTGKENVYRLTNVTGQVTVKITTKKISSDSSDSGHHSTYTLVNLSPANSSTAAGSFRDVASGAYYFNAVEWAVENGITSGTTANTFSPNQVCTRAEIVTFLWRASGSPEPRSTAGFRDVAAGSYYAKAVAWAVERGITSGTTANTFSPNQACTRAEAVAFLYRAFGEKVQSSTTFRDVAAGSYYADAVAWATENDITSGVADGLFGPNQACTRAQIVTFLYRAFL